jgi:hypothetical protein
LWRVTTRHYGSQLALWRVTPLQLAFAAGYLACAKYAAALPAICDTCLRLNGGESICCFYCCKLEVFKKTQIFKNFDFFQKIAPNYN